VSRTSNALLAAALAALVPSAGASAALVTFSGAYDVGQNPIPQTYQPLQNQYTGPDGTSDGADVDVTITWNNAWTSNPQANGGVYDHTTGNVPNRQGVVLYDGGNASFGMTFDQPVTVPDFYFANFLGGGPFTMRFQGFANAGDATAAVDVTRTYSQTTGPNNGGYQWIQENGLGATPIRQLVISGDNFKQIDDMTINVVPEPAALGLLAVGGVGLLARRRRA
jgi:hypothetical protein